YLMSGTTVRDDPEKGYNRIKVTGYDEATDTYYYSTDGASNTYETAGVTAGTELAVEYFYASKDLDSQATVTARATALLNYFQASSKVYTARLKQRMDLEIYQKVRFADYDKIEGTIGIPVDMRITRISYHHAAVNDYVEIEFAKDQDAQQLRRLIAAVNPDYVSGTLDIIDDDLYATGLIEPLGNTYLRTDKHATGDQDLYTDLKIRDGKGVSFYEPTGVNIFGHLRYFSGTGYNGMGVLSSTGIDLCIRGGDVAAFADHNGNLRLRAADEMFFSDRSNQTPLTLTEVIAGAGNLWEIDGSETQLITADSIDMQGHNIPNLGNIQFGSANIAAIGKDGSSNLILAAAAGKNISLNPSGGGTAVLRVYGSSIVAYQDINMGGNIIDMVGGTIDNADQINADSAAGILIQNFTGTNKIGIGASDYAFIAYANGNMNTSRIVGLGAGGAASNDAARMIDLDSYLPLDGSQAMTNDLNMGGHMLWNASSLAGKYDVALPDFKFWGCNALGDGVIEFMRWDTSEQNILIADKKITGLAVGSASTDAVRFSQLASYLPL
ncbi:hypothetical protein KAT92_05045, partial [Candidatus Babeliales bacterium]|nr:hypothetical protein [Candidatus Babeliales bacterium]